MTTEQEKIENFLTKQGWSLSNDPEPIYNKDGQFSIAVEFNEIIFIGERGDFLYLPLNLYALIGAMVTYRMISYNFSID